MSSIANEEYDVTPQGRCSRCNFYIWSDQADDESCHHVDCPVEENAARVTTLSEFTDFQLDQGESGILELLPPDIEASSLSRREKDAGVFDVFPVAATRSKPPGRRKTGIRNERWGSSLGITKRPHAQRVATFRNGRTFHFHSTSSVMRSILSSNESEIVALADQVGRQLGPLSW